MTPARRSTATSDRPDTATGIALTPLERTVTPTGHHHRGRAHRTPAHHHRRRTGGGRGRRLASGHGPPARRRLLHLRFNEPSIGTWVLTTSGDGDAVAGAETVRGAEPDHWAVREVRLLWARVLKRLDVSARSLVATVTPGASAAGCEAVAALRSRGSHHQP